MERSPGQELRTRKCDRPWMEQLIRRRIKISAWPNQLVRHPIAIEIAADTSADRDKGGGVYAARKVVRIMAARITDPAKTSTRFAHHGAILEVSDFVGKGHVVGMDGPRERRMLAGSSVHRMERIGHAGAGRSGGSKHDLFGKPLPVLAVIEPC